MDRRRHSIRVHTITLGIVLSSLGFYAFSPLDTLFVRTLTKLGMEHEWGTVLVIAGALLSYSGVSRNRYVQWSGNFTASLVCGWTVMLFWLYGAITPTVSACGVIAFGCLFQMIRDACAGRQFRRVKAQTLRMQAMQLDDGGGGD